MSAARALQIPPDELSLDAHQRLINREIWRLATWARRNESGLNYRRLLRGRAIQTRFVVRGGRG
jgi:maltooligosyltrehalose synthase